VQRKLKWRALAFSLLYLWSGFPAFGKVSILGKGFVLTSAGQLSTKVDEVISGATSIKGSYFGTASFTSYLRTDVSIIQFTPNVSYKITFRYRIITASPQGFEVLFYSPTGGAAGNFLPSVTINGVAGTSGTATLINTLGPYTDYQAVWTIPATGAITIDDIQILNVVTGQLVAEEGAEGSSIKPGPLNLTITDAKTFPIGSAGQFLNLIRSGNVKDLDGDGSSEVILSITTYPDQLPQPIMILGATPGIALKTNDFFPNGVPSLRHSPLTLFADVDGDGRQDILFADAGLDHPPWTGSGIGLGLSMSGGTYKDVSSLLPEPAKNMRAYGLATGDIDGDGTTDILIPGPTDGTDTALAQWNGSGFNLRRDWIDPKLWGWPTWAGGLGWVGIYDIDKDGKQDVLVGGNNTQPSLRILFGGPGPGAFIADNLLQLPDGPFGHTPYSATLDPAVPWTQGGDVGPVVVADFNNDGRLDIFGLEEQVINYKPGVITDRNVSNYENIFKNGGTDYAYIGFQVFINQGLRQFVDHTSASSLLNLGRKLYQGLMPIDMNNDGFIDIVGIYSTKPYGPDKGFSWGTTFFLNDGTGAFQVVDGTELLPVFTLPGNNRVWSLGAFLPTSVSRNKTEGLIVESISGNQAGPLGVGGLAGSLNVYKVVSGISIGTGPQFVDSGSLGAPGFNEFYYLRTYPDAAAAVKAGQFTSGLAHYLAVGKAKDYRAFAPNATQLDFLIHDHGGVSLQSSGTAADVATGYARIQPDSGSTTPAGIAIYDYRPGNYLVSETAVPATATVSSGRIYAEVNGPVDTGLAIVNPNNQPAIITFFYTDRQGNRLGHGITTLPPNSQIAKFLNEDPFNTFNTTTFEGTLTFTSSVPVAAMALRGFNNERGDFLMSTLPVLDMMAAPTSGTVVIPHFVDGGGWATQILMINVTGNTLSGTVEFRSDPDGTVVNPPFLGQTSSKYSVPPHSSQKLASLGATPETITGSVRILPDNGGVAPTPLLVFSYKPAGVTVSEAGVPPISGTAFRMYAESSGIQSGNIQTGIAVANNASTPISVTFELTNLDGSTTGLPRPVTLNLPGYGHLGKFLADIFQNQTLPNSFKGVVRISTPSASGISVVGLRTRYNELLDFLITTTPPANESGPVISAEMLFPHLANGGGFTTQFILFGGAAGQTSSGVLRFLSPSGEPLNLTLR
jgi:hypothetical protein